MKRYIWFNKETAEYFFNNVQEEFHKHIYPPHGIHSENKLNFLTVENQDVYVTGDREKAHAASHEQQEACR